MPIDLPATNYLKPAVKAPPPKKPILLEDALIRAFKPVAPPEIWRATEADITGSAEWLAPMIAALYPKMDIDRIPSWLCAMQRQRDFALFRTKTGFGLAQTKITMWEPDMVVHEIFTVGGPKDRAVLLKAMRDWATSTNAVKFIHDGEGDEGEPSFITTVVLR